MQSEAQLIYIEHPSIVYLPYEWFLWTSDLRKGRKVVRGGVGVKIDDSGLWWALVQEKVFMNETYFEGYQSDDHTVFLNKIMQDDAHGIRSSWDAGFERIYSKDGFEIDKDSGCPGCRNVVV